MDLSILLASVLAASPPIVFAILGETITEKAGVINLSLDGSLLLTAMAAFVVALETQSVLAGFAVSMIVGAFIAVDHRLREPDALPVPTGHRFCLDPAVS